MPLKEETIFIQNELAAYCRDGEMRDITGADPERLRHYRRLVYNVMYGLLEKAFPVTKSIISESQFKSLVSKYMTEHDAKVSQVCLVPGEFYSFLEQSPPDVMTEFPYIMDLLKMEWTEILVHNREDKNIPAFNDELPSLNDRLIINPDFEILNLEYPVFKGDWERITLEKGGYRLLVFRNIESFKVHFIEISPLYSDLIEMLMDGLIFSEAIAKIISYYLLMDSGEVEQQIRKFVFMLKEKGFVLGTAF